MGAGGLWCSLAATRGPNWSSCSQPDIWKAHKPWSRKRHCLVKSLSMMEWPKIQENDVMSSNIVEMDSFPKINDLHFCIKFEPARSIHPLTTHRSRISHIYLMMKNARCAHTVSMYETIVYACSFFWRIIMHLQTMHATCTRSLETPQRITAL